MDHYKNGTFSGGTSLNNSNASIIKNFIGLSLFSSDSSSSALVFDQIASFKIPRQNLDCLRFNGATKKQSDFFSAYDTNYFFLILQTEHKTEPNSELEHFEYSFRWPENFLWQVYISENYLNSFLTVNPLWLHVNKSYHFELEIPSFETKLGERYNECKEQSTHETYHQMNCVESCIYREIGNNYNCTFMGSLFSIEGLEECLDRTIINQNQEILKDRMYHECKKECPVSCYTVQLRKNYYTKSDMIPVGARSTTHLRFVMPHLSSLNITQIPKLTVSSLVSSIGGSLGLFMGLSFLNFVEVFEFIIDIFFLIFIS